MTIVSIHQPGYMPWLGFFKKILYSDIFVFLDDVKYVRSQYHNRNKIRIREGSSWLTVPVKSKSQENLKEVTIDYNSNWNIKHKKTLKQNYMKSRYFHDYWDFFDKTYDKKFEKLIDLNMKIIKNFMNILKINTKTIFSSELNIKKTKSERILAICKALEADVYLSGALGINYLKVEDFTKNNITVEFQNFQHPVYSQVFEPFIPNLSTIDLIFNKGKDSAKILLESKTF